MTDQTTITDAAPTVRVTRDFNLHGRVVFPEPVPTFTLSGGPTAMKGRLYQVEQVVAHYWEGGDQAGRPPGRLRYYAHTARLHPDGMTIDPDGGGEWDFASGVPELDDLMAIHLPVVTVAMIRQGMPFGYQALTTWQRPPLPGGVPEVRRAAVARWAMRTAGLNHYDVDLRNAVLEAAEASWPADSALRHHLARFYYAARMVRMDLVRSPAVES